MSRAKIERAQCIVLAQKHRALSIFIGRGPRVTIRGANCDMRTAHGCCDRKLHQLGDPGHSYIDF